MAAETRTKVGMIMSARPFCGTVAFRLKVWVRPAVLNRHDEPTTPIGVSIEAFAQLRLLRVPGAGGAMTSSLQERLPGARRNPASVV